MVEVVTTDEFAVWYQGLDQPDTEAVNRSVRRLEQKGVTLGFPPLKRHPQLAARTP